ncbi:CU044_5270 family protein [Actinoplanes solisilvae]|uniref:CU044_5270 family protein n=1 Tax=Actinoplanes solisilvae TaxID=2486853 RepID=UPI000FDB853F|nr:CU044_5270 family protein [Actinoplanes solisilvae]
MWTDQELDRALADLPTGPSFSSEARAKALGRLADAQKVVPLRAQRRRRVQWWAAAAAVVLVAGVAWGATGGPAPAASAAAVDRLDRAADSATSASAQTAPGQYFRTTSHAWSLGAAETRTGKPLSQLQETVTETWVPHERGRDWVKVSTVTGQTKWLVGSDDLVKREGDGGLLTPAARTREVGPCGDFPTDNGQLGAGAVPCDERPGDWYSPTPSFLASLPHQPFALYERLRADAGQGGPGEMLQMAAGVLASDSPAELRARVYRALTFLPGLDVTADAVNLDGRSGVALGVDTATIRQELVIDPAAGRLIGERLVLMVPGTDMYQGLAAGTVLDYTAVTTAVVASPGA